MSAHRLPRATGGVAAVVVLLPRPAEPVEAAAVDAGLTEREREVGRLITAGLSAKQIGGTLGISTHTVRHHTERIFTKLGVRSRASVAALLD